MSETTLEAFKKKVEELDASYQAEFAGKNRTSVDIGRIEALMVKAKSAVEDFDKVGSVASDADQAQVRQALSDRFDLFEREYRLIQMTQKLGPTFDRFMQAGTEANVVFAQYNRHFAGQSRETRDLALLHELIEDLKQVRQRMLAIAGKKPDPLLQKDIDLVRDSLERYQTEAREIAAAQAAGTVNEQADRLAALANAQFALYATHFAGKSRVSRRPQLLKRIIDSLRGHRAKMFALKNSGFSSDANSNNIDIVDGRVKSYEVELEEIRKVRKANKLVDIMSALGGAANELFEEYRRDFADKNRMEVSLDQLVRLLDQLGEIRRQMAELGRAEKNEVNEKNQRVVMDFLSTWIREYTAIRDAQSAALAH
jgi:hypothetical protein